MNTHKTAEQPQLDLRNPQAPRPSAAPEPRRPRGTSERWTDARAIPSNKVKALHALDKTPTLKVFLDTVALIAACVLAVVAWSAGQYLLMGVCWLVAGFLGNIKPLAFHDASHGTLHPSRPMNELLGVSIATSIMVPLSVYRYAHAKHHARIATEEDPELWPFTVPGTSPLARQIFAFLEFTLGFLVTPLLFLRAVLIADDISPGQKTRMQWEYALIGFVWASILALVALSGTWELFVVGVVVPWVVAGAFQTLNKYVEHLGMMGVGVMASTRSVVPRDSLGEFVSDAWQNVAHHGTHHLYAKIPHYHLPAATSYVVPDEPPEGTVFDTYTAATVAMLKTLGNPRVGPQWREAHSDQSAAN